MTTAALSSQPMTAMGRPSLEELVDRVIEALFAREREAKPEQQMARTLREATAQDAAPSTARVVHEARRLRQAGDLDGALATLAGVDMASATTEEERRWAYAEWLGLARRRFADSEATLYSPGTGKAAVLVPREDCALEVVAVLGMRWQPGRIVSKRSLRRAKALAGGGPWS